jgi:hypothetical protein
MRQCGPLEAIAIADAPCESSRAFWANYGNLTPTASKAQDCRRRVSHVQSFLRISVYHIGGPLELLGQLRQCATG